MDTIYSPDHRAEVHALCKRFTDLVASTATTHDRGLEALLMAYLTVAKVHPCCTQEAANAAMRASAYLSIAAGAAPADKTVH